MSRLNHCKFPHGEKTLKGHGGVFSPCGKYAYDFPFSDLGRNHEVVRPSCSAIELKIRRNPGETVLGVRVLETYSVPLNRESSRSIHRWDL